jgi:Kef-type K+ transport system membrane component KefB
VNQTLITDLALCVIAAWVLAVVFQVARQPVLLAYLIAGFLLGPHGFGWVQDREAIDTIADIGLILLLFLIGLEIDLRGMLRAGRAITVTALVQIVGCGLLGWFWFRRFGLAADGLEALYLGVAAALSSTVIIVKILHDKRELQTLVGRVTLGVLVSQDLAAILFLALQPNLRAPALGAVVFSLGKVVLLMGVAFPVSRYLLPPLFQSVARLPELVLVGALAWCLALAGLADVLGLSREMGALVAGVAVSTFPYALDVVARVTSIRDFFVTLFFVGLGMSVPVPTGESVGWVLAITVLVMGSRLLTVFLPLHFMSQGHRGSLLPAINLCQISELSLVILALGRKTAEVSERALSTMALAFAFLAVGSTYAIIRNDQLLRRATPWLRRFGFSDLDAAPAPGPPAPGRPRVFLLGFSWTASSLLEEIRRRRPELLADLRIIDFNPAVQAELRRRGVSAVYGDVAHREVLEHAGVAEAEIIVCSLSDTVLKGTTNLKLLQHLRLLNPRAQIMVHAEKLADVAALHASGAACVVSPRLLEANELLAAIAAAEDHLLAEKRRQLEEDLRQREEVLP